MNDLAAWLRTQLDADERVAKACQEEVGTTRAGEMYSDGSGPAERDDFPSYPWGIGSDELAFISGHDPAHELRDIEARRRIIGDCIEATCVSGATWLLASRTIRYLAARYADRPGYRQEWTP